MKKVQEIRRTVRNEDGNETITERDITYRLPPEDDYVKIFNKTVSILHNVEGAAAKTLNELLKRVTYENEIVLAPSIKDQIAEAAGLKRNTVEHHIIALCKKRLIIKKATNVYLINTYVFGRGKWKDIVEHRKKLPIKLVFSEKGVDFTFLEDS